MRYDREMMQRAACAGAMLLVLVLALGGRTINRWAAHDGAQHYGRTP